MLASCCLTIREAQSTINPPIFASAGDTFPVSTAAPTAESILTTTGANAVWGFFQLVSNGQTIDTFLSQCDRFGVFRRVQKRPSVHPNLFNQATRDWAFNLGTVNVSDVFNFFLQQQHGSISNPASARPSTALSCRSSIRRTMSTANSCSRSQIPLLELRLRLDLDEHLDFLPVDRNRQTVVDGWGSVTDSSGTYNALRVVSTIVELGQCLHRLAWIWFEPPWRSRPSNTNNGWQTE